jgi:hypothetical protein
VTGGDDKVSPTYNWLVSAGRITEGQGSKTIIVDTSGLAGKTITATLSLGGFNLDCSGSCSVSLNVPKQTSRRFDEFPTISRNDEKARLDNFAVELQNDPSSTGYVVIHPGRMLTNQAIQRQTNRIVDYLVNSRRIDSQRITTIVGPTRSATLIQLWIVPQGADPPTSLP